MKESQRLKEGREEYILQSSATYRKYSLTACIRQQSSLASHTLVLIMHPLWSPDFVSDCQNYISGVHVHRCQCTLPRCLWMLGPHRHSCDWSLSEWKVKPSQMSKATHTHTHTHTRAVDASRFPSSHSQEDFMIGILGGSLLILRVLLGDVYPHLVWPLWTV